MHILLILLMLTACKVAVRDGEGMIPDDDNRVTEVTKLPYAQVANPPPDSNADTINLQVSGVNANSYRYALVSQPAGRQNFLALLFGQVGFIGKLLNEKGEEIFGRILEKPAIMHKVRRVGMKMLGNQKLLGHIMIADGIDIVALTAQLTGLLSDMEKMNSKDSEVKEAAKQKVIQTLKDMTTNKNLMAALVSAMTKESEFTAQLLLEEKLISDILGQEEFVAEILAHEKGQLLAGIVEIPVALSETEKILAAMLRDKALMDTVRQPGEVKTQFDTLVEKHVELNQATSAKEKDKAKIKQLRKEIAAIMKKLNENQQLMAMVFAHLAQSMLFDSFITPPTDTTSLTDTAAPADDTSQPDFPTVDDYRAAVALCKSADYSAPLDIDDNIIITNLGNTGNKIICVRGVDDAGNEQQQPSTHQWQKTDSPAIIFGLGLPPSQYDKREVNVAVTPSDNSLVGYRYLFREDVVVGSDMNCPYDKERYGQVYSFSKSISVSATVAGIKLLCVFGVDSQLSMATTITSHSWYYTEKDLRRGSPRMEVLGLIDSNNYFQLGSDEVKTITLKNISDGILRWHGTVSQNISWLHVSKTLTAWHAAASSNDVSEQLGFIRGTIAKGEQEKLKLKLANPQRMNYGKPYYREGLLTIHNSGSYFRVASLIRLLIPKLKLSAGTLYLNANKTSGRITVENAGYGTLRWSLFPLPTKKSWLSFTPHFSSGAEQDYISFSVDRSKIPTTWKEHVQHFAAFSNGDSSTAEHCTNAVARDFSGQEYVSWPTEDCYDLKVVYRK